MRGLSKDLEKAGRGYELWEEETAPTADTAAPPLPAAEIYTTGKQLRDAERAVTQAYWSFQDTAAGRRLMNYGSDRPDAEALKEARREVSIHRLDDGLTEGAKVYTALYRAAAVMHDNLVAERKNAPKMMERLALVVQRAGAFAAGLTALAEQDPNSSIAIAASEDTVADQAETASPETEADQLDIFTADPASPPEADREDDSADTVPETAAEAEPPDTVTEPRSDAEQTQPVDLPDLTARQKAHLLRTHDELLTRLTVSSFTHVQEAGVGVPGVVDVVARTVTTDPDQPREQEMRCLILLTDQVRHYRQQLAEKAQAIPVADEAQALAVGEFTGLAWTLDRLGDAVANATEENRRYVIPTKSFISQQLNDGQIETALLGFARAARNNISLEKALKGKNIVVGPRTTGMAWHDLTLEFAPHGDTGVVLSISTPDSRARDEILLGQLDLRKDTAGQAIRAAFEEHVAGLGARADAARQSALDQVTPASSAAEATSTETEATDTERPEPAAEADAEDVAVAPHASDPDAAAVEPSAVSEVSDQDSQNGVVRLADTVLGGARLSREETIAHWGAMANPHPDGAPEAEAWERGRTALVNEVERSRASRPSPGGALLAYKVPGRKSVWSVVQVATGHPVLNRAQIDIPRQSTPQAASRYTVMELPEAAVPHYLAALERGLDPDGNQIDWTDHASVLRTAEPWRLAGSATRLTLGGDPATVGLREVHAAALLFAATKHPHAVGGAPAFASALHVILPSRNAVWGSRIAGDVVDDFTTTATQFSADGPALEDIRQHRKLRIREQDQTTYAVVRLAAAHAFGGRPREAVDLLLDRAETLAPSDEARPYRYSSNRLRHLATAVAELFSPVETELEQLLAASPGDHLVATAATGSPGVGATWVITGPAQRRPDSSIGGWRATIPVDRLDDAGPVHGVLHVAPHEISRRIWVSYDHAQPDHSSERTWAQDQLYHVAAGHWAVIDSGDPLPTTAPELEALTRRAERAFAGEATQRADLLAGPVRDGGEQAEVSPGGTTPAPADATVQDTSDAATQPAEGIVDAARTNIRALLDGIDVGYLSTATQELDELQASEAALEMIWRGLDIGNTALLERPAGKIASDVLYGTTRGTGFEPDPRAQLAVKSGLGVPTATALHALATEFLARRDADDPLGRALAKTRVDEVAWDLITVAKQMGIHGGFTIPAAPALTGPATAPETVPPQTAAEPDEPEPDFDVEYDEAGFHFVDGMHGISQLFVDNHWVLQETQLVEIGGMWSEHWARHDVSVAVSLTPDDRVLSTVFRRHGPFESPDWEEIEFTSAQSLRDLVEQTGLHGLARPARLPGLWRVGNFDLAENARAAAKNADGLRLVTRQADTRDPAWSFADDGKPAPLAPPLPIVPVTDRKSLLTYVLGDRHNEDEIRNLVSISLSGRVRKGVYPSTALRQLRDQDPEIYRRAFTASAGRRYRGDTFDYARAQEALVRLAEGDPALPLNALGQYIELQEGTRGPDADRLVPVRGIVSEIGDLRGATGQLTVTIDRDVPAADGTLRMSAVVDVDDTLTVLNLATRPTVEEREARSAATPPVTETEEQSLEPGTPEPTTGDTAAPESPGEPRERPAEEATSPREAPTEDGAVLRLSDGRELTHVLDPGPDQLPRHFTIAEEAYVRTEPGRFRLIIGRNYADTGDRNPWWWALQRIDQDGVVSGSGFEAVTFRHVTVDGALDAAQRHLAPLEAVLDSPSPSPSEKTSVSGPMDSITFIPAWGDVCEQLQDIDLPAAVEEQPSAQLAVTVAQRLIKAPSPEDDARWLLSSANAPYAADATRQLRNLATVIRASGLSDLIPGTEWQLGDALEAVRDAVVPQLEPPATTAPEPELGEITLPPEPIDEDTEILPPDLADLGVEQIFLELDRWRHPRAGVGASGVPESVAAVHNRLIDLLTPDTIAVFGDRTRGQVATQVQDSYRFNLLAEAVREAQEASEPLRPDFRKSPAQDVPALDRETWTSTFDALVEERDPESSVRWGRIRITVELGGAAIAQIAIADPDTGDFEVTHRLPFDTKYSLEATHDPIGDTLWAATYGAKAQAILARHWIHESLHENGLSPLAQAQARLLALPSTAMPGKQPLYYEIQKIESHIELLWTWALAQLNELDHGRPPGDEDAFSFSFLEFDAADPGEVLATAAVRDTVGQESEHLWWRGLRVYTEHTKEGELELVFCETNGQGGWLLTVPLTREQFTPEGVTAALYSAVANAEQDVIDRTNTALATIAAFEAPAQPAPDREATAPTAADTAAPETTTEPDPEPGNESEPDPGDPETEPSSHADAAPSGQQPSSSSDVQPGLFDLATPGTPSQSGDTTAPATTEGRSAGELSRAPLTPEDIALALRRTHGERLADFLKAMNTPGAARNRPSVQGHQVRRSDDEPDAGALEQVDVAARAMEIRVETSTELRTGRLSWKALNEWLRAGLAGADLRMLTDASTAHDQLTAYLNRRESTKDTERLRSGLDEVAEVRDRAAASIIDRALRNHQADTAPAPWRGRGRDPLLRPASDGQLTEAQQATLATINDLTSAIPDSSVSDPKAPDGAPGRGEPSTAATSTASQTPKPAESSPAGPMGSNAPAEEAANENPRPDRSTVDPAVPAGPLDAITFDPSGPGAAEQLTSMQMPDPVKLHEPSRLAFVAATRIVQQPTTALAMHVTWLANVASSTTEAAEAAQQLLRLADRITRSTLPDQVPGSDLRLITALDQARQQLLTRLGLPTTPPPDAPPGPDAAADPGTASEKPAAEDATVSTTDVLSDLQLSWEQLEEMAQEANYTVVLQRHVTEPSTDHALRTITIPLIFDKDVQQDQLTSEVIALLRNPPPTPATADTTPATRLDPSSPDAAQEGPAEGETAQPADEPVAPGPTEPGEPAEQAPAATPIAESLSEPSATTDPGTPAPAAPRTPETHVPDAPPDAPRDTLTEDTVPSEAESTESADVLPTDDAPAAAVDDSESDEDLAAYDEYLAGLAEPGREPEQRRTDAPSATPGTQLEDPSPPTVTDDAATATTRDGLAQAQAPTEGTAPADTETTASADEGPSTTDPAAAVDDPVVDEDLKAYEEYLAGDDVSTTPADRSTPEAAPAHATSADGPVGHDVSAGQDTGSIDEMDPEIDEHYARLRAERAEAAAGMTVEQARAMVREAEEIEAHLAGCQLDVAQCSVCSAQENDVSTFWEIDVPAARQRLAEAATPPTPIAPDGTGSDVVNGDEAASNAEHPAARAESRSAPTQEPQAAEVPRAPRGSRSAPARTENSHGAGRPPRSPERERRAPDPVASQWADLVAQASTLGFGVRNSYEGVTTVDWTAKVIQIGVAQPVERVVALALKVGEVSGVVSATATAPQESLREQDQPSVRTPPASPSATEPPPSQEDPTPHVQQDRVVQVVPAGADSIPVTSGHPLFDDLLTKLNRTEPPLHVPETWPSGPVHREPAFADRQPSLQDNPARETEEQRSGVVVQARVAPPQAVPVPSDHPVFDQLLAELGWEGEIPALPDQPAPTPALPIEHAPAAVDAAPARPDPAPAQPSPSPPPERGTQPEPRLQQRPAKAGERPTGAFVTRTPAARGIGGAVGRAFGALGFGRRNGRR
ncbi:hypothetical protein AB0E54_38745 [Amycolatopsis coloradensis]|uniref:hypothetical protein n=1 Tax=Amycolatopsis coloradensis TaxID=76021 RepID=UPI0033C72B29